MSDNGEGRTVKTGSKKAIAEASQGEVPKHRSSKDTRRWCKGIVGREHQFKYEEDRKMNTLMSRFPDHENVVESVEVCTACRKERNHIWRGFGGSIWNPATKRYQLKFGPGF